MDEAGDVSLGVVHRDHGFQHPDFLALARAVAGIVLPLRESGRTRRGTGDDAAKVRAPSELRDVAAV